MILHSLLYNSTRSSNSDDDDGITPFALHSPRASLLPSPPSSPHSRVAPLAPAVVENFSVCPVDIESLLLLSAAPPLRPLPLLSPSSSHPPLVLRVSLSSSCVRLYSPSAFPPCALSCCTILVLLWCCVAKPFSLVFSLLSLASARLIATLASRLPLVAALPLPVLVPSHPFFVSPSRRGSFIRCCRFVRCKQQTLHTNKHRSTVKRKLGKVNHRMPARLICDALTDRRFELRWGNWLDLIVQAPTYSHPESTSLCDICSGWWSSAKFGSS